eukprot:m.97520 g.97520  ORF g.97520 m.97520 type:complete len:129 (-) comp14833_c0_seq1:269-655(-)
MCLSDSRHNRDCTGVEMALIGRCPKSRLHVVIPPHLGFDDPELKLKNKPVPDGAHVDYDVVLVSYETPTLLRSIQRVVSPIVEQVWPLMVIGVLIAGYVYYSRNSKSKKENAARAKIKRTLSGKPKMQ